MKILRFTLCLLFLAGLIPKALAQWVDGNPPTYYGIAVQGQCLVFAQKFAPPVLGVTIPVSGYAARVWTEPSCQPTYTIRIPYGTDTPQPLDIGVMKSGSTGHIFIVDSPPSGGQIMVVDSNWNGDEKGRRHTITLNDKIYGFFRRKPSGTSQAVPSVTLGPYGNQELFCRGRNGLVYHIVQGTVNGAWNTWESLGGPYTGNPKSYWNSDGGLAVYVRAADPSGCLMVRRQTGPGGQWKAWETVNASYRFMGDPAVSLNQSGQAQVFVHNPNNSMDSIAQQWSNGPWGYWGTFGCSGLSTDASVRSNYDGTLELVARLSDGTIWFKRQLSVNGDWAAWQPLGNSVIGQPKLYTNQDRRLQCIVLGSGGVFWTAWQTSPRGSWSGWSTLPTNYRFASNPTIDRDPTGRLVVAARGTDNYIYLIRQTSGGWGAWQRLGNATMVSEPTFCSNADGRFQLYAINPSGVMYTIYETRTGGWSNWEPLGDGVSRF